MANRTTSRRGGMTLVEMLVVIAIIAILAAILIPAGSAAIRTARRAANAVEIADLMNAIDRYKSDNGGLYPPSFGEGGNNATFYADAFANNTWRNTLLGRYVMKAYPKATPTDIQYLFNSADNLDQSSALWFWLTQTYEDVRYPFTGNGSGTPRSYAAIEEQRIVPGAGGGIKPRHAGESFYIYIESRHYPLHVADDLSANQAGSRPPAGSGFPANSRSPEVSVRPWLRQAVVNTNRLDQRNYMNGETFQLFCAGLDSRYSVNHDLLRKWPCGLTGLDFAGNQLDPNAFMDDRDNQANFSDGAAVTDRDAQ